MFNVKTCHTYVTTIMASLMSSYAYIQYIYVESDIYNIYTYIYVCNNYMHMYTYLRTYMEE